MKHINIVWDFEIQMDYQIQIRELALLFVYRKKACYMEDFTVLTNYRVDMKQSVK